MRRSRPQLEGLEGRVVLYSYSFIGFRFGDATYELARNWQSTNGGTTWPQNAFDSATFATTSQNITIPADIQQLGTLDLEPTYRGTMTCAGQLDLNAGLVMRGGTLVPFKQTQSNPNNGDLLVDGNSSWDGGTLGNGSCGAVQIRNGATLTVARRPDNQTDYLATNLYVGARDNTITNPSGNVNLQSVTVDMKGTSSTIYVQGWNSLWGTLDFGIDTTINPPVGDTITNGGNHAQIVDYGVVNVDGNPGNDQLVTHTSSIPIAVSINGALNVRKMNKITFTANLSNHSWAVEATNGGQINMGGLRPNETGDMGSAQLWTASDGTYGVHIDNTIGVTGRGSSFNVYGEKNVLNLAGSASQLSVDGNFTLSLKPDGSWQHSTLEVTTGFVNFGVASLFTFYADPLKGGPNCLSDNLTVDAGDVNFNASGSRPTVSALWFNGGDNIRGLTSTLDFLNTPGGQIKQNVGRLILTGNNPPGATGTWSLGTVGTPVTELDAIWTSN